jgi:hypothetical protein
LLGTNQLKPTQVEDATSISADIQKPDSTIFNVNALNPTTAITISQNNQNLLGN